MSKGIWEGLCLPPALLEYRACPQAGRARDGRRFTPVQPRVLRLLPPRAQAAMGSMVPPTPEGAPMV